MTSRHRGSRLAAGLCLAIGMQASFASPQSADADDALVGLLINAIVYRLDGREVEMKLDAIEREADGITGIGKLRIQGAAEWMGFRFQLPRDYRSEGPGDARIEIGGVAADEHDLPNDPGLVRRLEDEIVTALAKEPGNADAAVQLQLDRIATVAAGASYRRIDATGTAYFGKDGGRAIRIEALYDQGRDAWLYAHYRLADGGE